MAFKNVILEKSEHIGKLIFNRPESNNSISTAMFKEIIEALNDIKQDDNVWVMVLGGAGKHFCTSVDQAELMSKDGKALMGDWNPIEIKEFAKRYPQAFTKGLIELEKPTIVMAQGLALADAFDWFLACDLRVAATNARFVQGYAGLALFPNTGSSWLLPRAIGIRRALEFLYTGGILDAKQADQLGLLTRLVAPEDLEKETMALARQIAAQPPIPMRLAKAQVYKGLNMTLDQALELSGDGEAMTLKTEDHKIALAALKTKSKGVFTGR